MRDSGEFERSTGGESYEWSIPTAPDPERNYRMFVSIEADLSRLICVEECPVTSDNPGARRMEVEGVPRRSVTLTLDDARWLLATLPKAIERVERVWAEGAPPGAQAAAAEAVHVCLWSSQPDILIACDHSWTTPAWGKEQGRTPAENVYRADDGRLYTFDESLTTCLACRVVLGDTALRAKAGTP